MIFRRRGKKDPEVVRHPARCSFCGNQQSRGVKLIAGAGAYICSDCIALANEILRGNNGPASGLAPGT